MCGSYFAGDAARHSEIRQAVAHFIDANADSLENYLLEDDEYKSQGNPVRWENVAQYAAYVATDFSYCESEIELIAISELYRVQVCTKTHDQSHDKSYKPLGWNGETVELVHYVGTHFREFRRCKPAAGAGAGAGDSSMSSHVKRKQGKEADGAKTQQGKKGKHAPKEAAGNAWMMIGAGHNQRGVVSVLWDFHRQGVIRLIGDRGKLVANESWRQDRVLWPMPEDAANE